MRAILTGAVAALVLSTSLAFAAQHVDGTVKAFNMKALTLTLSNGHSYLLPKGFKDPGLKAGVHVAINYSLKNGKRAADSVTIMK